MLFRSPRPVPSPGPASVPPPSTCRPPAAENWLAGSCAGGRPTPRCHPVPVISTCHWIIPGQENSDAESIPVTVLPAVVDAVPVIRERRPSSSTGSATGDCKSGQGQLMASGRGWRFPGRCRRSSPDRWPSKATFKGNLQRQPLWARSVRAAASQMSTRLPDGIAQTTQDEPVRR